MSWLPHLQEPMTEGPDPGKSEAWEEGKRLQASEWAAKLGLVLTWDMAFAPTQGGPGRE